MTLCAQQTLSLRGVHALPDGTVWASGTGGTILHNVHGGAWQRCGTPPGGDVLDFRGIHAFSEQHAFALASGPGPASRLFETVDGCQHWQQTLQNSDADGFWDALVFADAKHGWILGDPVRGRLTMWATTDGGAHWAQQYANAPRADAGESLFAASNSSLAVQSGTLWFGTGGAKRARVWRLRAGKWSATIAPVRAGSASAGIFSLAFRDAMHGVAVGGDYKQPEQSEGTAAFTADGGETWLPAVRTPAGYRSSVGWWAEARAWVAAGPNGVDLSRDDGHTWSRFPGGVPGGNALSPPWLVGAHGFIKQLNLKR